MFKKAFEEGRFGYACSLGMVLFVMILLLTIVYNKYVKVEKWGSSVMVHRLSVPHLSAANSINQGNLCYP